MASFQDAVEKGDAGTQNVSREEKVNSEDKFFNVISEKGDHSSNANVHDQTRALIAEESGSRRVPPPADDTSESEPLDEILRDRSPSTTDDSGPDTGNKRKRTESPDSEIIIINDNDNDDQKSIGSGMESDIEENDSDVGESERHTIDVKKYDPCIDNNLPETVTLLEAAGGSKLYLIGTAHFSVESQNDVAKIIQAVQPDIVMVELCKARIHILRLDEKTILQEAQKLSFLSIRNTIQQNGFFNGLMYILLLNMSAHLTKELGMAPGGEFRTAYAEAQKVPNCLLHMGDRPINITIQRALSSLSWWQTFKLGWHLLTSKGPISREEVERCKRRDLLEEMLAEMTGEFPALGEVFVKERDLYLTHSLQLACLPQRTTINSLMPVRVVGVVGIGHVSGIVQHWGKVKSSEIPPILKIPPQSMSSKVLRFTVKASFVGAIIFVGYKIIPLPSGETIQSLKSSVEGLWKETFYLIFLLHFAKVFVILLGKFLDVIHISTMEAKGAEDAYEHPMPGVIYAVSNIPGPGADLEGFNFEFSVGCSCDNDCKENCGCIRGSVNYVDGCISHDKLAGPIVECNGHCECGVACANRLVQFGPLNCLTIVETDSKGFALCTARIIKKGQFICEYAGEIVGLEEAKRRIESNYRNGSTNYVLIVSEHLRDRTIKTCIDPKYFGNIGRYCNHSCDPNACLVPVRVEGPQPKLCLFAVRDIPEGEEVTFNYAGQEENSVHNISQTPCVCRSPNCLGYLPHHPI